MESALATFDLKPVALRPDQIDVDQLILINQDTLQIGPLFYLDDDRPWQGVRDASEPLNPIVYKPVILGPEELMGRELVQPELLNRLNACVTGLPQKHHEAMSVFFDEFYDAALNENRWNDWLFSELLDQLIINRNDRHTMDALHWLRGPGGDSLSRMEEFECMPWLAEVPAPLEELPTNWRKVLPKAKHAELLATLNTLQVRDKGFGLGDMP
jgi:hypothetical protein